MDINEISSRLADIQGQLFQVMQMIEPGKLVLDGLASIAGQQDGTLEQIDVPGGYIAISPELGIFAGDGVATATFTQTKRGRALRVLPVAGKQPPSRLIVQLNVDYVLLRGRNLFDLQATWSGTDASDAKLEVRLFGSNGVVKRDAVDCYIHTGADSISLRAPVQFSGSVMRSEAIHQAQFCLSFNPGIYGAEFTALKVM